MSTLDVFVELDYEGKTYYIAPEAITRDNIYYPYLITVPTFSIGGDGYARVTTGNLTITKADDDEFHPFYGDRYYSLLSRANEIPVRIYYSEEEAPIFVGNIALSKINSDSMEFLIVEEDYEREVVFPVLTLDDSEFVSHPTMTGSDGEDYYYHGFFFFKPDGVDKYRVLVEVGQNIYFDQTEIIFERDYESVQDRESEDLFQNLIYDKDKDNRYVITDRTVKTFRLTDHEDHSEYITLSDLVGSEKEYNDIVANGLEEVPQEAPTPVSSSAHPSDSLFYSNGPQEDSYWNCTTVPQYGPDGRHYIRVKSNGEIVYTSGRDTTNFEDITSVVGTDGVTYYRGDSSLSRYSNQWIPHSDVGLRAYNYLEIFVWDPAYFGSRETIWVNISNFDNSDWGSSSVDFINKRVIHHGPPLSEQYVYNLPSDWQTYAGLRPIAVRKVDYNADITQRAGGGTYYRWNIDVEWAAYDKSWGMGPFLVKDVNDSFSDVRFGSGKTYRLKESYPDINPIARYIFGTPQINPMAFGEVVLQDPVITYGVRKVMKNFLNYTEIDADPPENPSSGIDLKPSSNYGIWNEVAPITAVEGSGGTWHPGTATNQTVQSINLSNAHWYHSDQDPITKKWIDKPHPIRYAPNLQSGNNLIYTYMRDFLYEYTDALHGPLLAGVSGKIHFYGKDEPKPTLSTVGDFYIEAEFTSNRYQWVYNAPAATSSDENPYWKKLIEKTAGAGDYTSIEDQMNKVGADLEVVDFTDSDNKTWKLIQIDGYYDNTVLCFLGGWTIPGGWVTVSQYGDITVTLKRVERVQSSGYWNPSPVAAVQGLHGTPAFDIHKSREEIYLFNSERWNYGETPPAVRQHTDEGTGVNWALNKTFTNPQSGYYLSTVGVDGNAIKEGKEKSKVNISAGSSFTEESNLGQGLVFRDEFNIKMSGLYGLYRTTDSIENEFLDYVMPTVFNWNSATGTGTPRCELYYSSNNHNYTVGGKTFVKRELRIQGFSISSDSQRSAFMKLNFNSGVYVSQIRFTVGGVQNHTVITETPDGGMIKKCEIDIPAGCTSFYLLLQHEDDLVSDGTIDLYNRFHFGGDMFIYQRISPQINHASSSDSEEDYIYAVKYAVSFFNNYSEFNAMTANLPIYHYIDFKKSGGSAGNLTDAQNVYSIRNPSLLIPEYVTGEKPSLKIYDDGVELASNEEVKYDISDENFIHLKHVPFGQVAITGVSKSGSTVYDFFKNLVAVELKKENPSIVLEPDIEYAPEAMETKVSFYQDSEITMMELASNVCKSINHQFYLRDEVDDAGNEVKRIVIVDINYRINSDFIKYQKEEYYFIDESSTFVGWISSPPYPGRGKMLSLTPKSYSMPLGSITDEPFDFWLCSPDIDTRQFLGSWVIQMKSHYFIDRDENGNFPTIVNFFSGDLLESFAIKCTMSGKTWLNAHTGTAFAIELPVDISLNNRTHNFIDFNFNSIFRETALYDGTEINETDIVSLDIEVPYPIKALESTLSINKAYSVQQMEGEVQVADQFQSNQSIMKKHSFTYRIENSTVGKVVSHNVMAQSIAEGKKWLKRISDIAVLPTISLVISGIDRTISIGGGVFFKDSLNLIQGSILVQDLGYNFENNQTSVSGVALIEEIKEN